MKKLLSMFFIFILFANVSYAAFPVSDTLKVNQDTLQTEEIKQYHSNLIKMGIDLNDCKCESCRKSNKYLRNYSNNQSSARGLYVLSGLILLAIIIWISIGLTSVYNCVDSGNCPESSREGPNRGAANELLWISLLILISAGVAVKARFIQIRNKRKTSKNS